MGTGGYYIYSSIFFVIRGIGAPSYTAWQGAAVGAMVGLPEAVVLGSISLLFKNSKTFFVAGNLAKWKVFQSIDCKHW